jgi:crotonobetaine/carnitine-CoA ligase
VSNKWRAELKPGSCGRIMDGYEFRIADDDGYEVPPGAFGEMLIRPKRPGMISDGYWGMPERTLEAWRGLWFHTGDLVTVDKDGWFHFLDRKKDSIRRRGENISSFEVELAFQNHPAISEVAAYPIPSQLMEDDVALAIVLEPDATVDPVSLLQYAEDKVPYYWLPRYVTFLDELPKTPTQKVQKQALVQMGVTSNTWDMNMSNYRPRR